MRHDIICFQISMDNVGFVHVLNKCKDTDIPIIICLSMSIAYFSGILLRDSTSLARVSPLQN